MDSDLASSLSRETLNLICTSSVSTLIQTRCLMFEGPRLETGPDAVYTVLLATLVTRLDCRDFTRPFGALNWSERRSRENLLGGTSVGLHIDSIACSDRKPGLRNMSRTNRQAPVLRHIGSVAAYCLTAKGNLYDIRCLNRWQHGKGPQMAKQTGGTTGGCASLHFD